MKRVIVNTCVCLIVLMISIVACKQKKTAQYADHKENQTVLDSSDVKNIPVLKFAKTRYDFGTVKKKDTPIHIVFEFQNIGDVPLVIHKVDVSCGCLSAEYPKDPTMPKNSGNIKVKIDAKDFTGAFNKTLFVKSNAAEDVILLRITGQIK
jgi:hypothetical protein